ncbi:hypothetical protein [Paraliomyxa miuraensis]|uniref:hypothetical protein n=1 Tax=Paraliomyxa miuraensis TaxID=376150 RepID=UPI00224DDF42|nr:hypothetical protein [Paraliomyxa miuraensis]MCX4247421.1 hypothetical protein [Paraliomyxa miuraensis]
MRVSRGACARGWLLGLALALACTDDGGSDGVDDASDEPPWPLPRTCVPPPGMGSPVDIEELVALVDALPKPTSLACVLESLDRPLSLYASSSVAGAQPALGIDNPRLFLLTGDLTLSMTLHGTHEVLEIAQAIGDRRSIKAELLFPVDEPLAPSAPYDAVAFGSNGTACGLCHGEETRVAEIDYTTAWASDAYQDDPEQTVSVSFLRQHAIECDHEANARRCERLDALFGHGEVVQGDLDRESLICHPF